MICTTFIFQCWISCGLYRSLRNYCTFTLHFRLRGRNYKNLEIGSLSKKTFFFEENLYLGEYDTEFWASGIKFPQWKTDSNTPHLEGKYSAFYALNPLYFEYYENDSKMRFSLWKMNFRRSKFKIFMTNGYNFLKKKCFSVIDPVSKNRHFSKNYCTNAY